MPPPASARHACALGLLALSLLAPAAALADVGHPFVGVTLVNHSEAALVVVDLCAPGVTVRATRYEERHATPEQWAAPLDLDVAMNADFFEFPGWSFVLGRARGAGADWPPGTQQVDRYPYWQFGPGFAGWVQDQDPPPAAGVTEIVGGHDIIILNGAARGGFGSDPYYNGTHQRSALGMSADRRTLFLMSTRSGTSMEALGPLMQALAAEAGAPAIDYATNQDGGGSAQMYVKGAGQIVSTGRQVGNHIGIYARGAGAPGSCMAAGAYRQSRNVVAWDANRLDFFVRGDADAVFHKAWGGAGWSAWESMQGTTMMEPRVSSWEPGRLDLFAVGARDAVFHRVYNGVWSGWESLEGALMAPPTVVTPERGKIHLFGRGANAAVWHKWWDGTAWHGWESLEGTIRGEPSVVSWSPTRFDIFARGSNDELWHRFWNGMMWSGWESLQGSLRSSPVAVAPRPDDLHVFTVGADDALWHRFWNGAGWSAWESLGGALAAAPSVIAPASDSIHLYALGLDHAVWHKWWDGHAWHGWESLEGSLLAAPSVVSWTPGRFDIFGVGTNHEVWHRAWTGTQWTGWESLGGYVRVDVSSGADAGVDAGSSSSPEDAGRDVDPLDAGNAMEPFDAGRAPPRDGGSIRPGSHDAPSADGGCSVRSASSASGGSPPAPLALIFYAAATLCARRRRLTRPAAARP